MVECFLPKEEVASSSLVRRSHLYLQLLLNCTILRFVKKHFIRTLFLLLLILLSFGVIYYLILKKDYLNPFIVFAFFAGCIGIFFLAKRGRGDYTLPSGLNKSATDRSYRRSLIEQQSELGSQYAKHATTRDKLRMLKGVKE